MVIHTIAELLKPVPNLPDLGSSSQMCMFLRGPQYTYRRYLYLGPFGRLRVCGTSDQANVATCLWTVDSRTWTSSRKKSPSRRPAHLIPDPYCLMPDWSG